MIRFAQGAFAFCIWDDVRKQMFAARDPSGFEPLYYHFDEDEGIKCALSTTHDTTPLLCCHGSNIGEKCVI